MNDDNDDDDDLMISCWSRLMFEFLLYFSFNLFFPCSQSFVVVDDADASVYISSNTASWRSEIEY